MSDSFHKLVFDISEQLNERDHEALNYIYNLPDKNSNTLRSLRELVKRGLFSYSHIDGLSKVLRDINRSDLIEKVEDFKHTSSHFSLCPHAQSSCNSSDESAHMVRMKLCFLKARDLRDKLNTLQKKHEDFSNGSDESVPSSAVAAKQQFCEEMTKQFKMMEQDMDRFVVTPLMEFIDSRGGLATRSTPSLQVHSTMTLPATAAAQRVQFERTRSVSPTVPSTHTQTPRGVHLQAPVRFGMSGPGNLFNRFRSRSAQNIPSQFVNAGNEDRDGVDYETWAIIGDPEHERQSRIHSPVVQAPRLSTKAQESTIKKSTCCLRVSHTPILSRFSSKRQPQILNGLQTSQHGQKANTLASTGTRHSRIPIPVNQLQRRRVSSPAVHSVRTTSILRDTIPRSESYDSLDVDEEFFSSTDSGYEADNLGIEDSQVSRFRFLSPDRDTMADNGFGSY